MSKRPTLPTPRSGKKISDDRALPAVPDSDPHDDDYDSRADVPDEAEDLDDEFDASDWPDDEPLDEGDEEPDEAPDAHALDDLGQDAPDDTPLEIDEAYEEPEDELDGDDDGFDEPVVVPWRTSAHLPDHGLELPVVLDVTAEHSRWIGGPSGRTRITLAGLELDVDLIGSENPDSSLQLGRDAIAGRLLVAP